MIPVLAAIIYNSNNEILIAKRKAHKSNGGLWEFPGGKLEDGETPEACLRREILEELGLEISVEKIFHAVPYQYEHIRILLLAYFCKFKTGELRLTDHDEIRWVKLCGLPDFEYSPADIPIVQKLTAIFPEEKK